MVDLATEGQAMRRVSGILIGVLTQALFVLTVWRLFWFLYGAPHAQGELGWLWLDAALALQFAVVHSALLLPSVRRRLVGWTGSAFYGSFYCLMTCAGLLLTFAAWRGSSSELWHFTGWANAGIEAAFFGSWAALFYSLSLTGLGHQSGLTPWWHWVRQRRPPPRAFRPRGAYRWLRHPVYLSFLGLLWLTPVMTYDRAVLTGVWTVYIFIGSYLKDERLAFYLGSSYRTYQSQVTGYPLVPLGPLGKRRPESPGPERARPEVDPANERSRKAAA